MKIHVSDAVLNETTKCEHFFSCLETGKCGDRELCQAEYVDGERVIFLRDRSDAKCPYRVALGERQLCRCPTHYAILKAQEQRMDASCVTLVAAAKEAAGRTDDLAATVEPERL